MLFLQHCTQDVRFKFGRSNSHSHTSGRSGRKSTSSQSVENTVCHKSLPDLHTSTRRRASLSPRASTKSSKPSGHHQSSSNCPDCETSSDYSEHSFKRDAVCYRRYRKHFYTRVPIVIIIGSFETLFFLLRASGSVVLLEGIYDIWFWNIYSFIIRLQSFMLNNLTMHRIHVVSKNMKNTSLVWVKQISSIVLIKI